MGISTHILDIGAGRPAINVPVTLARRVNGAWVPLNSGITDADGRCKGLLPLDQMLEAGVYRVEFATSIYYEAHQMEGLYPYVDIIFEVRDSDQHYHIPLLLTANGYTTYRGS
jgi:5-hydroxyisourate hydrolase